MRPCGIAALAFAVSVLNACSGGGGGGSSAPPPPQSNTFSGTVAANGAHAAYDVDVVAPAGGGAQGQSGTTGADGRYSVTVQGLLPPQRVTLIRAGRFVQNGEPQYQRLYSLPNGGSGNSNVTRSEEHTSE